MEIINPESPFSLSQADLRYWLCSTEQTLAVLIFAAAHITFQLTAALLCLLTMSLRISSLCPLTELNESATVWLLFSFNYKIRFFKHCPSSNRLNWIISSANSNSLCLKSNSVLAQLSTLVPDKWLLKLDCMVHRVVIFFMRQSPTACIE
jgi:hypothetical protein